MTLTPVVGRRRRHPAGGARPQRGLHAGTDEGGRVHGGGAGAPAGADGPPSSRRCGARCGAHRLLIAGPVTAAPPTRSRAPTGAPEQGRWMVPALCRRIRVTTGDHQDHGQHHQVGLDPRPPGPLGRRAARLATFDVLAPGHHPGHRGRPGRTLVAHGEGGHPRGEIGRIAPRVEEAVGAEGGLDADEGPGRHPGQGGSRCGGSGVGAGPGLGPGACSGSGCSHWAGDHARPPILDGVGRRARTRAAPGGVRPGGGRPRCRRRRRGGRRRSPARWLRCRAARDPRCGRCWGPIRRGHADARWRCPAVPTGRPRPRPLPSTDPQDIGGRVVAGDGSPDPVAGPGAGCPPARPRPAQRCRMASRRGR